MKSKEGLCPKCKKNTLLTRHHIQPLRFNGSHHETNILYICRICHSELETFIPQKEKMPDKFYFKIVELFLSKTTYRNRL